MMRNRTLLKLLAVFFALEILCNTLLPSLSFALTSGPTSPEHTSFEPVDVTDMVNVSTGDFVYNLPLFEVPGPSGGFPISMAYHAGIQPEVDASWVGLGWTLNTGAINRTVDGTPDDFSGVGTTERTFWEGGTTVALSSGVTFGSGAVTAGLSFSSDTYRGMSIGTNLAVGRGGAQAGFGLNYTVDSYGNAKTSTSATAKTAHQARFEALEAAYDRVSNASSIKSFIKGFSSALPVSFHQNNGKQGSIRSSGFDFNVNIPVQGLSIQLGGLFKRYWVNERVSTNAFGAIYFPSTKPDYSTIVNNTYDVNDLYYLETVGNSPNTRTVLSKNPSKGIAGTFPNYDSYVVTGQGIGGSIRPYHLKSNLYRSTQRTADNDSVLVQSYPLGDNIKPAFRFVHDFSNSFLYGQDEFATDLNHPDQPLSFQFKEEKITTGDTSDIDGYVNGALAGSRNIQYFTKSEVIQGNTPGFILSTALGYAPHLGGAPNEAIEGFKITNESGVKYHYALPVYSYDEYSYSGSKDYKGKYSLNLFKRLTPYAYAWLLTAMTGPDYVDVNADGIANEGDTGYWITFEYGKWARGYGWRNPAENFNKDIDRSYDFFSKGKKEIYYLNAIKSATHTALFVKELRRDGKGVVHDFEEAVKFDGGEVDKIDKGGFWPIYETNSFSTSTLRLKEILLLKNEDMPFSLTDMAQRGTTYNHAIGTKVFHYGANVIDVHDIADIRSDLLQKSVRSVELDHDYLLTNGVPNADISFVDNLNSASAHLTGTAKAKLTLKAVKMNGRQGVSSMPSIKFSYDLEEGKIPTNAAVTYSGDLQDPVEKRISKLTFSDAVLGQIEVGDIVRLYNQPSAYTVATLIAKSGAEGTFYFSSGNANLPLAYVITAIEKTKNPPYTPNYRDIWGFFKSDYIDYGNENISRMVTEISAKSTDVWSLRKIRTVTGADIRIDYESDAYDNSIKQISSLAVKNVEVHNSELDHIKVYLHGYNARKIFKVGDTVKLHGVLRRKLVDANAGQCECAGSTVYFWAQHVTASTSWDPRTVLEVGDNYIVFQDGVVDQLQAPDRTIWVDCTTLRETNIGQGKRYEAHEPYVFVGGDLQFNTNKSAFSLGGGLRVKKISVKNDIHNTENSIAYEYRQGVTSYEPLGIDVNVPRMGSIPSCVRDMETKALEEYKYNFVFGVAYKNMAHLFANARLMPGPGVMYGQVNVRESTKQSDGVVYQHPAHSAYFFEVFNPKLVDVYNKSALTPVSDNGYKLFSAIPMGDYKGDPVNPVQGLPVDDIITSTAAVQDFSAVIGTLKAITTFDQENRKISETSYRYLFDEISTFEFPAYRAKLQGYMNQGLIEEVFADAKLVRNDYDPNYTLVGLLTKFSQFPSIQVSSTSVNFKTGVTKVNETLAYDFYSGQETMDLSSDGMGNYYSTTVMPAYRQYPALSLGISGGRNMLIQDAGQTTHKVHRDVNGAIHKDGLLSASTQTWSDTIKIINPGTGVISQQTGVWRKHSSYFFAGNDNIPLLPDGSYNLAHFNAFDNWHNSSTVSPGWKRSSSVSLYDYLSHELEAKDINGSYACTKMYSDGIRVSATVSNARYHEAAYCGVEDQAINGYYGGNVARLDGTELLRLNELDTTTTHTGQKVVMLNNPNTKALRYTLSSTGNKTYHASVWVNATGGRLFFKRNGVTTTAPAQPSGNRKAGAWYLLELTIPSGAGPLEVWCETAGGTCNFDDLRVHPIDASMTSYVYNKWDEVSHIMDNNGLYTEFQSDATGKLIRVFKENFSHGRKQLSETIYHYAQ